MVSIPTPPIPRSETVYVLSLLWILLQFGIPNFSYVVFAESGVLRDLSYGFNLLKLLKLKPRIRSAKQALHTAK